MSKAASIPTLKRAAPAVDRTAFSLFNDVGHLPPEKKRRKQASTSSSSKDLLSSSGALSSYSGSRLSEVLAAAAADGSHSLLHRAALSRSASSTISSSSASASGEPNTHPSVLSRLAKTLITDSLMPPPPPLSGDLGVSEVPKKSRPSVRLNPNTGLLESGVSGGETSSEGEADHELEARGLKSLDLAITKQDRRPNADLKLKLKLPSRTSITSSRSSDKKRSESQQHQQHDEPKLPKLILSMRDKTVKMAASKASKASFVESGQDYDDGDDGDDDEEEEFNGSKLKSPLNQPLTLTGRAAIDRVLSAPASVNNVATCDSKAEHLDSPESAELDSPQLNNHSESVRCVDEISLRLSDQAAATALKVAKASDVSCRSGTNSLTEHKKDKEVFQQLVIGNFSSFKLCINSEITINCCNHGYSKAKMIDKCLKYKGFLIL